MGVMITLKFGTLLLACVLTFCQMYISQAAPSSREDPMTDGVTLSNDDIQKLLRAIKEFMQLALDDDHQTADGNSPDRSISKRCTGLSTCVLGKLSQDIHKLQTYPRTDVGAGTPGKKRSLAEQYEHYGDTYN
ncbi:calcitonin/calcitonin-related polypeptide, alpha isoform X2 [Dunckerocampus dactyliophorus]|uniref:calcitonin/calcitonin-related polypeptide, alpha isoform X2 n=1 Tax=Dunckerocampus dactyliophorus TaxID=161453 RepID=UPI0024062288|nr:calcitonin/calcitonin-related polypeptide, alpha isoform X2 [Dunckerocampus dactyliophorus]